MLRFGRGGGGLGIGIGDCFCEDLGGGLILDSSLMAFRAARVGSSVRKNEEKALCLWLPRVESEPELLRLKMLRIPDFD